MKALYAEIAAKAALFVGSDNLPRFKHIAIYNDQTKRAIEEENKSYSWADPGLFIEIQNQNATLLGNGAKFYPNLKIIFHIAHRQEDAADGTLDENKDVLDLKDDFWLFIEKFQPTRAHPFGLGEELEDTQHNNMYFYRQAYNTNYTVLSRVEPYGGVTKAPPTNLEQAITISPTNDSTNPHIYD